MKELAHCALNLLLQQYLNAKVERVFNSMIFVKYRQNRMQSSMLKATLTFKDVHDVNDVELSSAVLNAIGAMATHGKEDNY